MEVKGNSPAESVDLQCPGGSISPQAPQSKGALGWGRQRKGGCRSLPQSRGNATTKKQDRRGTGMPDFAPAGASQDAVGGHIPVLLQTGDRQNDCGRKFC